MTFQAKLTTKLENYSIDDAIVELKNNVGREELSELVKAFLRQLGRYDEHRLNNRAFDFLVGGRLLRLSVEDHLKLYSDEIDANEVLSERLVEVEFILALDPPEPLGALQHDDWVSCVDANEAHIISGSYDNSIRLFNVQDRMNIVTIKDAHEKPITRVRFMKHSDRFRRSDSHFLSCGHDEVILLRRLDTESMKVEVVAEFSGHSRSVNCIDTCDDMFATGSFDKTLRLWSTSDVEQDRDSDQNNPGPSDADSRSKKQRTKSSEQSIGTLRKGALMTLTGHQESVTGVKWLGSCNEYNSVASCSMDRSICTWDIEVGECKRRILSAKPILGIDFCNEKNLLLSASCDQFVRTWDARAPDNAGAKAAYTSHSSWISSVAFGPASTNHFISGGYDNIVKLWDLRSSKTCLYDLIGHHDKVLDVNWANPAYSVSGSADSTLKVFAMR